MSVLITGSGLYTPKESISNEELVASYNSYVDKYNAQNKQSIKSIYLGNLADKPDSLPLIAYWY